MKKLFQPTDLNKSKGSMRRVKAGIDYTAESDWSEFRPKTNVLWLHYLADKLLNHKHLLRPHRIRGMIAQTESSKREFTELNAHKSIDIAFRSLHPGKKTFRGVDNNFDTASDVLEWGKAENLAFLPQSE